MAATLNQRVLSVVVGARRSDAARVELLRVVGKLEELVCRVGLNETADDTQLADRICARITDELDDAHGRVVFVVRAVTDSGAEPARERLRCEGRAQPPARIARAQAASVVDDDDEGGEAQTPTGSVAVLRAVMSQQYTQNRVLFDHLQQLSMAVPAPLLKTIEILSAANERLMRENLESAQRYASLVRQERMLEAEAQAEARKARAMEWTAEQLGKFLPVAIARISRHFGGAPPPDAEQDPLLEKLVLSITEEQLRKLMGVFDPAQMQIFAEVWQNYDARRKQRDEAKKTAEKSNGAQS